MDAPWKPWQTCGRGHPLALHGAPRRRGQRRTWYCKLCARERAAMRVLGHDPEVVYRLVEGRPVGHVTPSEHYAAVRELRDRGVSIIRTAEMLSMSPRGVSHIRKKLREGTPYGATKSTRKERNR